MRKAQLLTILLLLAAVFAAGAQPRREITLKKGWLFSREDNPAAAQSGFNDGNWQSVTVPHDWAIYGPFDKSNDIHRMAIVQDGQTTAIEHYGRTGGLPFTGAGWYRNRFTIPGFTGGKRVHLLFDGAMSNARVYVNGREVGYWPNGYNSFYFDITDFVHEEGRENLLAVRLENFEEQSRWYPGAGLYRNVHLIVTEKTYIPIWGSYVTTPVVTPGFARVNVRTRVESAGGGTLKLVTQIRDETQQTVATAESTLSESDMGQFSQELVVENPRLWDIKQPNLYTAVSRLYEDGRLVDEYCTPFGIRTLEIRPDEGFFLNGREVKFKGVCLHHDLGPLGAAVNEAAIRRQIRTMQDMGANAIRTSHNMPAPEFVRIADEMGMMLMVESFDEWAIPKVKNGYNRYFKSWAERDLVNLLHHYRNNPSVVMWCIGNEVEEQSHKHGSRVARFLQDICHREDPTRPVTNGMDRPDQVLSNHMAAMMEVPGFNYRPFRYREAYDRLPQQIILGSETASTLSSRGVYKFPVVRRSMAQYDDHQASSYDVEHCSWSNLPEDDFIQHDELPYTIGEFIWTGIDYLGEPTPYYSAWPSHSSLFGAVDLAGIPKDRFYLYRSHWNSDAETLHILPHWNWKGREGEVTPIFVYTSYPSAELFINGKSQGLRTKDLSVPLEGSDSAEARKRLERQKRYRLMWMDTRYEPGTVRVVAYDNDGKAVAEKEIHTAGKPHRIVLEADRREIDGDGEDIAFVNVKLVDKAGNFCPTDDREISFTVKGAGRFKAVANGNPASLESFQLPRMKLFSGQLTALVQAGEEFGTLVLEAKAEGVRSGRVEIRVK